MGRKGWKEEGRRRGRDEGDGVKGAERIETEEEGCTVFAPHR